VKERNLEMRGKERADQIPRKLSTSLGKKNREHGGEVLCRLGGKTIFQEKSKWP